MKKIIISICTLSLLFATSCSDFLTVNPVDKQVKENYFKDEASVRANTASLYSRVWFKFINSFMWLAGDAMAGDVYYTYSNEGQFFLNTVQPGNPYSEEGWSTLYLVASYANSIIIDMPEPAREAGVSEEVINKALGEAYLFRGLAYYYLTEYWGEVPIIENSSDLITSGNASDMYVNKATQGSLYRFICEDLKQAVSLLPESDTPGRVNKFSAEGLLAKVYLTRGCYVKGGGADSGEGSAADYFAEAKKYAKDVIDNGPKMAQNYSTMYNVSENNNSESLIAFQAVVGGWSYGNSRTTNWGRSNTLIGAGVWGAGKSPTISIQEEFEKKPADGRRKWVYMRLGDTYPEFGNYTYKNYETDKADFADFYHNPNEGLAHIKKYVIPSNGGIDVGGGQDAANNLYLLRVSDVYFVYAEACLEGDFSATLTDADGLSYINQVLNRGGDSDAGYTVASDLSYLDLIKERRKEFALEGTNWFDIKRLYYISEAEALDYLNKMYRDKVWAPNWKKLNDEFGDSRTNENLHDCGNTADYKYYVRTWTNQNVDEDSGEEIIDCGPNANIDLTQRSAPIIVTKGNMLIAIPANATTKAPILLEDAVDYYAN